MTTVFRRLRAAWRALWNEPTIPPPAATSPPPAKPIIEARMFGRVRQMQLNSRRGGHAIGRSVDEGPMVGGLIGIDAVVGEEDREKFAAFIGQ